MDDGAVDREAVIDLDQVEPQHRPESAGSLGSRLRQRAEPLIPARSGDLPVRWRRWTAPKVPVALAIVLMLLVGAGAVIATRLWLSTEPSNAASGFSVVTVPGEAGTQFDSDRGEISLDGMLTVVNAGSKPVTVTGLEMDPAGAGLTRSVDVSIAPGRSAYVEATVWYQCPTSPSMEIQIAVDFKPAIWVKGPSGTQRIAFRADQWAQNMITLCMSLS